MFTTSIKKYKKGDSYPINYRMINGKLTETEPIPGYILREATFDEYAETHQEFIQSIGGIKKARRLAESEGRHFYFVSVD